MPLTQHAALSKDRTTGKSAKLQHRHFAFIAAVIADIDDLEVRRETAYHFADALQRTNPNFDRDRFYAAAKVTWPTPESLKSFSELVKVPA